MKLYKESNEIIEASQYIDPLMIHLSQKIIFHLGEGRGRKLLDIGCGAGRTALLVAKRGFKVEGVDVEERVIKLARRKAKKEKLDGQARFTCADIYKGLRFKKESFDVIICSEVIEHVPSPKKVIREAKYLLKTQGILILTTPHSQRLWTITDEYAEHRKRFETEEIKKMLKSENFEIKNLYTVGFPLMVFLFIGYNFLVRFLKIKHSSSWRTKKRTASFFSFFVSSVLKFDDIFNSLKLGTNFIVVSQKV